MVIVLSGPSGVGKSTLVKEVVRKDPSLHLAVSCTTRKPKEGERDGIDYHFLSLKSFLLRRDRGEFAEWAEVHEQLYGTPVDELAAAEVNGRDLLLEIDCRGAFQIKERYPSVELVFILPPSFAELEARIRNRKRGDTKTEIAKRLAHAKRELCLAKHFDYRVVNGSLEDTVGALSMLIGSLRGSIV